LVTNIVPPVWTSLCHRTISVVFVNGSPRHCNDILPPSPSSNPTGGLHAIGFSPTLQAPRAITHRSVEISTEEGIANRVPVLSFSLLYRPLSPPQPRRHYYLFVALFALSSPLGVGSTNQVFGYYCYSVTFRCMSLLRSTLSPTAMGHSGNDKPTPAYLFPYPCPLHSSTHQLHHDNVTSISNIPAVGAHSPTLPSPYPSSKEQFLHHRQFSRSPEQVSKP